MTTRAWLVLGALASSLFAIAAEAHLGHVILRAERYLKLDASEADTRIVVSLTLGPSEGARILGAADANGDHDVSQAEADAYLTQWGVGLETDLPVEVDGAPVRVSWVEGYMEPIGPVTPTALTVEITAHVPVTHRDHVVRFRDHMRRDVFDRTDVAFRAHDGAELVTCGPGEAPAGTENDFGFTNQGEAPDVFTTHVRYPSRSDIDPLRIALPIGGVIVIGLGLVAWRRRRK